MKKNIKAILAPMSPKERISYIWDYYKFHIIGTIVAIILLVSFISSMGDKKEVVLNVTILGQVVDPNAVVQFDEQLTKRIVKDESKEEVLVQNFKYDPSSLDQASSAGMQKVVADLATGLIDILIMNEEQFEQLSEQAQFYPLSDIKGFENVDLEQHTPYYSKTSDKEINGLDTDNITQLSALSLGDNQVLCIPGNTEHLEAISKFFTLIAE